ncbi:MAG: L,D-transpeptidase [Solirubrobacteraceae bacterium]|nr:L,D-transpeptidase [Solirubrobacteraceae bacterium]
MHHGFVTVAAAVVACLAAAALASAEAGGRTVVNILDRAPLYSAPDGPLMAFGDTPLYERGSAWVVRRQGDWLGISTIERNRGKLAWIRRTPRRPLTTTRMLVVVDLSERRVHVQRGARALMSAPVTVGAPSSPSPIARTSVWKRIKVTPRSGFDRRSYGPVIVALRLWQDRPSPGNPDGGIMAFHGGGGFARGRALSGGCFRMRNADVLRLAYHMRAGTPVIIRP